LSMRALPRASCALDPSGSLLVISYFINKDYSEIFLENLCFN